ncbi:DUF3221 domain-containing protein [Paenibacillus chitinolyticus]|uniref:DUF3221 domain-containing protein n=1 Tax=Paenibacillus chitinolyticus TaxID=79263 RepID=UPI002DBA7B6F|nr:DUF3221 domain-containing protein [Paenibacillus chitinolyticus]MEC0248602.1 DUF3221 domain-containing protein [Paenibacillus chitinolyticus]
MKMKMIFLFILSIALIGGCGKTNKTNEGTKDVSIIGYVVKTNQSDILIVSETSTEKAHEAIWIPTSEKIKIGEKVEVFLEEGIQTSDPMRGVAKKINIVKIQAPASSILTPEKALEKAFNSVESWELPVVKEFSYLDSDKQWNVVLIDAKNRSSKTILIDDKI